MPTIAHECQLASITAHIDATTTCAEALAAHTAPELTYIVSTTAHIVTTIAQITLVTADVAFLAACTDAVGCKAAP